MNAVTQMEAKAIVPASQDASPFGRMLAAQQAGIGLDQIREMMALQVEWEKREAEKAYNVAFSEFKAEAVQVIKGRRVTDGPLKNKSYAELHDVVDAVTPALSRHGLSASWKISRDEKDWLEVTCTLKHVGGHSEFVSMGGPPDAGGAKNALQARASTKTYLERYTLKAICGVAEGGDDTDGNAPPTAVPLELLSAAREAAMGGWKSLAAWIKTITPEQRTQLAPEEHALKKAAKAADEKGGTQ